MICKNVFGHVVKCIAIIINIVVYSSTSFSFFFVAKIVHNKCLLLLIHAFVKIHAKKLVSTCGFKLILVLWIILAVFGCLQKISGCAFHKPRDEINLYVKNLNLYVNKLKYTSFSWILYINAHCFLFDVLRLHVRIIICI